MEKIFKPVYCSKEGKTKELASLYAETDQLSHRYLAYRDIPDFISEFVKGRRALDYGAGTGISSSFLHELGFCVTGSDISSIMLEKARSSFPQIEFLEIDKLTPASDFDLIFSSFVLFDMSSKIEIVKYLSGAIPFMKEDGVFILITGSEHLYSPSRTWTAFDSNFEENYNLCSGGKTRLKLKCPEMEFYDYFWKESDYLECFQKAGLEVVKIHNPLGSQGESYLWEDERFFAPFTVFICKKSPSIVSFS